MSKKELILFLLIVLVGGVYLLLNEKPPQANQNTAGKTINPSSLQANQQKPTKNETKTTPEYLKSVKKIDDPETLKDVPQIGSVLASRITKTEIQSKRDLKQVKGIGDDTIQEIKTHLQDPPSDNQKININKADRDQLQKITHIGEKRAEKIIKQRPFCSYQQLLKVKGIGDKTLKDIKQETDLKKSCQEKQEKKTYQLTEKELQELVAGVSNLEKSSETKKKTKDKKEDSKEKKEEVIQNIKINSTSKENLQKLKGIGPAYAQKIIEQRPFCELKNLLEVDGIGKETLQKIQKQEAAIVEKKCDKKQNDSKKPKPEKSQSSKQKKPLKVEINSAEKKDLKKIDSVGSTYAKRIIEKRPFCDLEELSNVQGLGEKTIQKISTQEITQLDAPEICERTTQSSTSQNQTDKKQKTEIKINHADKKKLTKLPHVGEARAESIQSLRPFCSWQELTKVDGISLSRQKDIESQKKTSLQPKNDCNHQNNSSSPNKKSEEDQKEKQITLSAPSTIQKGEKTEIDLKISNFSEANYDVKITIKSEGNNLSQIYNEKENQWQSSFNYLAEAVKGPTKKGNFQLKVKPDQDYKGQAQLLAKIRKDGQIVQEKETNIQIIASGSNQNDNSQDKENNQEKQSVEINTAARENLQKINGIGDDTADNFLNYRENNSFCTLSDLKEVSGIGDSTLENIKENNLATVDPPADCFDKQIKVINHPEEITPEESFPLEVKLSDFKESNYKINLQIKHEEVLKEATKDINLNNTNQKDFSLQLEEATKKELDLALKVIKNDNVITTKTIDSFAEITDSEEIQENISLSNPDFDQWEEQTPKDWNLDNQSQKAETGSALQLGPHEYDGPYQEFTKFQHPQAEGKNVDYKLEANLKGTGCFQLGLVRPGYTNARYSNWHLIDNENWETIEYEITKEKREDFSSQGEFIIRHTNDEEIANCQKNKKVDLLVDSVDLQVAN